MADSIDRILGFLQEHNLDLNAPLPARFHYGESALICLDTVLSIGRDHGDFVEPRMNHFLQHWPRVRSLPDLRWLIERKGPGGLAAVWNYWHPARAQTLERLVDWFLIYQREHDINDDLDAMRHWALQPGSQKLNEDVDGLGFAPMQYIRMLAGADTVMPDQQIRRAVGAALGYRGPAGEKTAVEMLEAAALRLDVEARKLDSAIREAAISITWPR